jgi:hypothetical protein
MRYSLGIQRDSMTYKFVAHESSPSVREKYGVSKFSRTGTSSMGFYRRGLKKRGMPANETHFRVFLSANRFRSALLRSTHTTLGFPKVSR